MSYNGHRTSQKARSPKQINQQMMLNMTNTVIRLHFTLMHYERLIIFYMILQNLQLQFFYCRWSFVVWFLVTKPLCVDGKMHTLSALSTNQKLECNQNACVLRISPTTPRLPIISIHIQSLSFHVQTTYGSGHKTAAVLLPGFAINW